MALVLPEFYCKCTHVHSQIHIFTHTLHIQKCTQLPTNADICAYTSTHNKINICICTCKHILHTSTHTHAQEHSNMYAHIWKHAAHTCIYKHLHINTHTSTHTYPVILIFEVWRAYLKKNWASFQSFKFWVNKRTHISVSESCWFNTKETNQLHWYSQFNVEALVLYLSKILACYSFKIFHLIYDFLTQRQITPLLTKKPGIQFPSNFADFNIQFIISFHANFHFLESL